MKKHLIISLAIFLILVAILFFWKQNPEESIRSGAEEDFYIYLKLPSFSGGFLEFDEDRSEIRMLYLTPETMKVAIKSFKVDKETIFSKATLNSYQPDLFPRGDLKRVGQEARVKVFYLTVENEIPLARLIQAEALF